MVPHGQGREREPGGSRERFQGKADTWLCPHCWPERKNVSLIPAREAGQCSPVKRCGRESTDTGGQQTMSAILYEKCTFVDSPLSRGLNSCVHMISRSVNA